MTKNNLILNKDIFDFNKINIIYLMSGKYDNGYYTSLIEIDNENYYCIFESSYDIKNIDIKDIFKKISDIYSITIYNMEWYKNKYPNCEYFKNFNRKLNISKL